jgi:hypothetical protein
MITREQRLDMFSFYVLEKRCPICKDWPRAESPQRREDIDVIPIKGACARCVMAFVKNICVMTKDQEETDALREAIREDRRKANPRPNGHELLKEIRARKLTKD